MSKKTYAGWAVTAALLLAGSQAGAVVINVGSGGGMAGEVVPFSVTLSTEGEDVAGTQNDIMYAGGPGAQIMIAARPNGRPDCMVNPDIMKGGTSFAFQPPGCSGDACTAIRALVLALDNVDPIPDGSVLYTCQVQIIAGAAGGEYPLANSNTGASDPDGGALPTTGTNGAIEVVSGPAATTIVVGDAEGMPGDMVSFEVSLNTSEDVAGTQNDIAFDPEAAIAAGSNGRPLCAVNPDIEKGGTSFAFQPPGCTVGTSCTGIRALVLALDNVDPIPDGSVMYTCQVAIAEGAEVGDTFPLACSNSGASDPDGGALPADCEDGTVTVGGVVNTPTNTIGPQVPTPTPTVTGVGPTATRTTSAGPTATGGIIIQECDDDACAIVSPSESGTGWLLLLPAAMLLWLRRRSR